MGQRVHITTLFGSKSSEDIQEFAGVTPQTVKNWSDKGVPMFWADKLGLSSKVKSETPITWREYEMICDYKQGKTLEQIGEYQGITRERVRQILKRRGVTRFDGGVFLRCASEIRYKPNPQDKAERRCIANFGCSIEAAMTINSGLTLTDKTSAAWKFSTQKKTAAKRKIGWEMTFPQWMKVWSDSGKWLERGRGMYVMARIGDTGPYAVDNVEIITASQNSKDSYYKHPACERAAKRAANREFRISA